MVRNEITKLGIMDSNGVPMVSSRKVAEIFGKRHADVLRSIENLDCSEKLRQRNFALSAYLLDMPDGGKKELPEYLIAKDGFTLLVMGFSGEKAMQFKEAYINAFNQMDRIIRGGSIVRIKSKVARNIFTDALKEHGYTKRHEYIQTTQQMKNALGITKKKDEMSEVELALMTATEMIASVRMSQTEADGYYECNPLCVDSARDMKFIVMKDVRKRIRV